MFLANGLRLKNRVATGFTIDSLASLVHWFAFDTEQTLDGLKVTEWGDQATADNDLTQTDSSKQPNYNNGELDFSPSATQLLFDSDVSLQSFTICIALKTGSNNTETIIGNLSVGSTLYRIGQAGSPNRIRLQYVDGATYLHDITAASPYPSVGTEYVLTITRDTTGAFSTNNQIKTFVNTSLKTTTTFNGAGSSNFIFNKIGSHGGVSNPFDGSIHEFVIFNEALGTTDLENVVNDIMTRNGIS
tara:strand:+ start:677 stop:1411 length:735 start_codon:yes stop_codon:yes gene_type:complete